MKRLILSLILICFVITASAQTANVDTSLKFDNAITAYERHWVVLKKPVTASYYTFGYVYIDKDKGFMFKEAGQLEIRKNNKYVLTAGKKSQYIFSADNADQSSMTRVIRCRDTIGGMNPIHIFLPLASILPAKYYKELNIEAEPKWVKPYYTYTDTLEHNYKWGSFYIQELTTSAGINYLEKVYQTSPHYKGVKMPIDQADWIKHQGIELILGVAYNDTEQYDKAIHILNAAILNDPVRIPFYQVLMDTYYRKKDWDMVIEIGKKGLAQMTAIDKSDQKRDLAALIAYSYEEQKDDEQGKYWRAKSLEYSLCPGCIY